VIPITSHVKSHILEKVIGTLMALFGIVALFIFFATIQQGLASTELAIIEILLIIVLAILAQTIVLIRIYEQNQELLGKR
jgi:succinate-acetate transporter protein